MPKPLFLLVIWENTAVLGFSVQGQHFPKARFTEVRVSAPAPYKNPTVILSLWNQSFSGAISSCKGGTLTAL